MREIRVTGEGKASLTPDQMIINFEIISESKTYEATMLGAKHRYDLLKQGLINEGFTEDDLKTVTFYIERVYESIKTPDDNHKTIFKGFKHHHMLKLEFPFDNDRLGKVLNLLASGHVEPDFNIQFSIKDKDKVKNELLVKATEDALEKATILAESNHVKLGEIILIDSEHNEMPFVSPTRYAFQETTMAMAAVASMDITPEDIKVVERVHMAWEIK